MNKKIITLLLAATLTLTFAGCTPKENSETPNNQGNQTQESTQNGETASGLDADAEHYRLMIREPEMPYTLGDYIQTKISRPSFVALDRANAPCKEKMNKILEQAYNRHTSAQDDLITMLDGLLADPEVDIETVSFPWVLETSYELAKNDGKAISLLENVYYFAGGAHPSQSTFTYNFDPATGDQIDQVFYDGGDAERDAADEKLYKMLTEKYSEEEISYDYISSSFVDTLADCWYFTDDGIKVVVSAGDIAPYAAGTFELEIAKEDLAASAQKYFK